MAMEDGSPHRIVVEDLARKILALYPNGVPPDKHDLMMSIMGDFGVLIGIIGALQLTAGHVFLQHAKGNTEVADLFFEALLSITIPERLSRRVI